MRPFIVIAVALLASLFAQAAEPLSANLEKEVAESLHRGATYLIESQNPDGSWGSYPHPAISALCAMAIHNCPGVADDTRKAAIDKAMKYVLSFCQDNGAIYPAERDQKESANYPNYTTSISLLAMATIGDPAYIPSMKAARRYLQDSQFGDPNSVDYGGIGYGKTGRADLSNGSWAAEALYYTEYLDTEPYNTDPQAAKRTEEMWQKMQIFLTKVQNLPETNKEGYVSSDPDDLGGFVYRPNESKAGSRDDDGAVTNLISSGSMTYAGLKSMIYARLDREDIRVKGAMSYLRAHWTLEENPGMGLQGLYYYLLTMTKALEAYGQPRLTDTAGQTHDWRQELAARLVAMQGENGSWVNSQGRYMESFAPLPTAYSMIALKTLNNQSSLRPPAN